MSITVTNAEKKWKEQPNVSSVVRIVIIQYLILAYSTKSMIRKNSILRISLLQIFVVAEG